MNGVHSLHHDLARTEKLSLEGASAPQIMSSPVVGVSPVASVPRVVALLQMTSHNGFPVLAPPEDVGGDGGGSLELDGRLRHAGGKRGPRRLQGMILRSQLLVLLERGAFCDAEGAFHFPQSLISAPLDHAATQAVRRLRQGANTGMPSYRSRTTLVCLQSQPRAL